MDGVAAVYKELADPPPFFGLLVPPQLTTFEYKIIQALGGDPTKVTKPVKDPTKIYRIPLEQSRYKNVKIERPKMRNYDIMPWAWEDKLFVDNGLAFVFNISGQPMGTDKWG